MIKKRTYIIIYSKHYAFNFSMNTFSSSNALKYFYKNSLRKRSNRLPKYLPLLSHFCGKTKK